MSDFLNKFTQQQNIEPVGMLEPLREPFAQACRALVGAAGPSALRYQGSLNAANVDAILATLMELISIGRQPSAQAIEASLRRLRGDTKYFEYVTKSTSHRENVVGRLQLAYEAFSGA